MSQQHLDRLTSIDASFLHQEHRASHMHIGGVLLFEGPPPAFDDFLDHVRGRLHLVPRYRQKLATPPLETGRPLWVDDPDFNLEYHVRHTALPSPGSIEQLFLLASRIASQQLDRSKPLWENWLVEGLADGRFALISKTHHALVDGISGVDLASVLFDVQREPAVLDADLEPWRPEPEPSPAELVLAGARGMVSTTTDLVGRALVAATHPGASLHLLRDAVEGVGEIVWAGLNPAPQTPLNVQIGPHRRYAVASQSLADYKEIKDTLGGTVNDLVLTVVTGALGAWLRSRGVRTEGLEMRALVPVSVRTANERGTLGNRLTAMRAPLPVYIDDPAARLRHIQQAMDGLKESKQAVGAATLTAVNSLAPPTILAQASRLNFSTRLFNLLVTNIPGPQFPLYVLGRKLDHLFPVAFLPENQALAIAIMSYNGNLDYGLLGDYDAMPDIELIAESIDRTLVQLLAAVRSASVSAAPRAAGAPVPPAPVPPAPVPAAAAPVASPAATPAAPVAPPAAPVAPTATPAAPVAPPAPAPASASPVPGPRKRPVPSNGSTESGVPAPFIPAGHGRPKTGPAADMRAAGRARREHGSRSHPKRSGDE